MPAYAGSRLRHARQLGRRSPTAAPMCVCANARTRPVRTYPQLHRQPLAQTPQCAHFDATHACMLPPPPCNTRPASASARTGHHGPPPVGLLGLGVPARCSAAQGYVSAPISPRRSGGRASHAPGRVRPPGEPSHSPLEAALILTQAKGVEAAVTCTHAARRGGWTRQAEILSPSERQAGRTGRCCSEHAQDSTRRCAAGRSPSPRRGACCCSLHSFVHTDGCCSLTHRAACPSGERAGPLPAATRRGWRRHARHASSGRGPGPWPPGAATSAGRPASLLGGVEGGGLCGGVGGSSGVPTGRRGSG